MTSGSILERLSSTRGVVFLDGPTGTELGRRGVDIGLPLWGAAAAGTNPEVVRSIHLDYLNAGAEVLTANTFRTTPRTLRAAGLDRAEFFAEQWTLASLRVAREAIALAGREEAALVAGSLAPIEDCYRPDLVPPDDELRREHVRQAGVLASAGADLILVETMNCVREAAIATAAAASTGLPVWTSFVVQPGGRLLSGEAIEEGAGLALRAGASALLVNCSSIEDTGPALTSLARLGVTVFGAYANAGRPFPAAGGTDSDGIEPERYSEAAASWRTQGARIFGSCCGTGPEHIAGLMRRFFSEGSGAIPNLSLSS